MINDFKILYKSLMHQFQHERSAWYADYKKIVSDVEGIRGRILTEGLSLNDDDLYANSTFNDKTDFIKRLFANTGNGVASNGQSIFSKDNFNLVQNDPSFTNALENLVLNPNKTNHDAFSSIWFQKLKQNNPVQTNRATAACTLNVSTAVDEGKFNQVFDWLEKRSYFSEPYSGSKNWYDKNVFLVNQIRQSLKTSELNGELELDEYWMNIFIWLIYENLSNPFSLKKQLVKYGAPGTGKTFKAREVSKLQFSIWKNGFGKKSSLRIEDCLEFVQFHPSFSYEDFIEGLRPRLDEDSKAQLQLQNGIFKSFCINAGRWEVDLYNSGINKQWGDIRVSDLKDFKKENHWDFINSIEGDPLIKDVIPPYFMIIDEINRAELSSVFGELMYCLEYRGVQGRIKTQYASLNNEDTGMLKIGDHYQFFIPQNLYIIASMNTIDRSVDSFDFALRRRFKWEEVLPDHQLLKYHLSKNFEKWDELADRLQKLNRVIENEPILGKDYCIGHAYLWELSYPLDMSLKEVSRSIWDDSLGSLLDEYLRGTGKEHLVNEFQGIFVK
ncbi:McrB family protein [Robertkochia sediminum]|uniref:McrB family protein n=1 Tax=Robertkochia sediminum TaxID=2785326 RepID=UPI0019347F78|nr:AAA family ATPase [Robertkochia sediminum]MBL7473096.1 AAA family ATPase [Robertkochia sediminum]